MKRCPKCEFIYEDEQSLCDMDGILLVFDSQPVPKGSLATPNKAPAGTHHSRGRLVTMLAALVLATVLYLVYFVSTQQSASRNSYSPAVIPSPAASSPNSPSPNDSSVAPAANATTPSEPAVTREKAEKPTTPDKSAVAPVDEEKENAKPDVEKGKEEPAPPVNPEENKEKPKPQAQPTTTPAKSKTSARAHSTDESKIGSFFKKTGRLLKKPFTR